MSMVSAKPSGDAHTTSLDTVYLSGLLFFSSSDFSEQEIKEKAINKQMNKCLHVEACIKIVDQKRKWELYSIKLRAPSDSESEAVPGINSQNPFSDTNRFAQ